MATGAAAASPPRGGQAAAGTKAALSRASGDAGGAASETSEAERSGSRREASSSKRGKSRSSAAKGRRPATDQASAGELRIEGTRAVLLLTYAATVTLIAAWALLSLRGGSSHQLESLPDVPPRESGAFIHYPPDAELPAGHVVRVGEARRFGDVVVEPLAVERSTAALSHYSGDDTLTAPSGGETVLTLRLRLTNRGDRPIAPLDRRLVYERRVTDDFQVLSNQFVASQGGGEDLEVLLYDLSPDGEWNLSGQALEAIPPGAHAETFLATGPAELDRLRGACRWRILLRKGYGPSGYGVLTMLEVPFDADRVSG